MNWWQRLIFWLTAPAVKPPEDGRKSALPPWGDPGYRVTADEAKARHKPRPLPPWELDRQRRANLAEVQADDQELRRRYGRRRRERRDSNVGGDQHIS